MKCKPGYVAQGDVTVQCAAGAKSGQLTTGQPTCVPECAAYTFGAGVTAAASGGCKSGTALGAGSFCKVKCAAGYVSQGDVILICAAGAKSGDQTSIATNVAPTISISCCRLTSPYNPRP